jgi:hypothetical protein
MALYNLETPFSPEWWLKRLTAKLNGQRKDIDYLDDLYRGNHPLPDVPENFRALFRGFQTIARTNYLALVVESPLERMNVVGFRVGDNNNSDDATWQRWNAAHLDADQVSVHRMMLALRRGYTMVGQHPRKDGVVVITPEHPTQVIHESYPEDRREVRAAMKMWVDDIGGYLRANVYLPKGESGLSQGMVFRYRGAKSGAQQVLVTSQTNNALFEAFQEWELIDSMPTGMDDVPVTPFENRFDPLTGPRGEFEDVIPIQLRVNNTIFHRLVAEQFGSFRQKAILDYVLERDVNGDPIPPELRNDPGTAWIFEPGEDGNTPSLFEFSQTSTADIISAAAADVRDMASISRTPPHYLLTGMVNVTGDALKAAETGLIMKVKREHIPEASGGWEATMAKAALLANDPTDFNGAETLWADPESRTLGELADAALKKKTAGVTWRQLMMDLGYTPDAIDRMESERVQDALTEALMNPAPVAGANSSGGNVQPNNAGAGGA